MNRKNESFRLAPMSGVIRTVTSLLLLLPVLFMLGFIAPGITAKPTVALAVAAFISVLYAWVWLRFRPTRFVITAEGIDVSWPLKRRAIERQTVRSVQLLSKDALKEKTGWVARVGAGGLWGGFGWLWTQRRGIVQLYVSRTDGLVWVERSGQRPWLISPENPAEFVRAVERLLSKVSLP